jgi:putative membrane protein
MIMRIIVRILATAAALLILSYANIGISVSGFYSALVVAILWGVISLTIKPVLNLLALPITIITFGLFSFVINALLFWLLATFVEGFSVAGFIPALIGSVVLSAVSYITHKL